MDDNCEEWVECMGVASGCGYQEVGVASGWNVWVWLSGGGCGWKLLVSGCFPHITYISLLLLYLLFFAAASLLLFSFC